MRALRSAPASGARRLLPGLLVLPLFGCASLQPERAPDADYNALFGAGSELAYATEFPVGSAAEAVARGDAALDQGDTDRALFEYIRALNKDSDNAEALYKIGGIHAARGNTQLAELAFRRALAAEPKHAGALTGLGILLTKKREYAEAESKLRAAVRADPALARAHNALGVLADIDRDYASAQRHYRRALAIAPRSPMLLNNLGFSRYLAGDDAGAISAFEQALELTPGYQRAWRNLGLVYTRQRRYQDALDAFAKVQDEPQAYNDVGYLAMLSGRLDDAESFFDQAIRLSPEYYELANQNAERVRSLKGTR